MSAARVTTLRDHRGAERKALDHSSHVREVATAVRESAKELEALATADHERARAIGERLERQRVVDYLIALDMDDAYEWESPLRIADRILARVHLGVHRIEPTQAPAPERK